MLYIFFNSHIIVSFIKNRHNWILYKVQVKLEIAFKEFKGGSREKDVKLFICSPGIQGHINYNFTFLYSKMPSSAVICQLFYLWAEA